MGELIFQKIKNFNSRTWSVAKAVALALTILLVGSSLPVPAQTSDPIADFPSRVKKFTLSNGLRVLVMERPTSPTVSFAMFIRTGGLDDEMGKSGLAHMFEHMLFKGTKTIGTTSYEKEKKLLIEIDQAEESLRREVDEQQRMEKPNPARIQELKERIAELEEQHGLLLVEEEFWKIYERAGGTNLNAATGYDYTNYTISLPVSYLDLWAVMEADRLRNPVLREFYKERSVVLEERRMRIENSPQGKLWEAFLATAFMAHPYGRPIVGWESDISRVTRADAETFFQSHYGINRLVVAVVGGVTADNVEKVVKNNFGSIKASAQNTLFRIPTEPPQEGVRRVEVNFPAEPSLVIGYHRPDMHHPDNAALSVLEQVLSTGRTSRFNQTIIEKKKVAVSAWAAGSFPGERDPSLFVMGGTPRAPHTTHELENALYAEVDKIKMNGVTQAELDRVKINLESDVIRSLSENNGLASQLAYYESVAGDWRYLLRSIEKIRGVTSDDVRRVANQYLVPSNRTVGKIVRKR